eukprot:TRINITY_DN18307_c0_g1_i1.p1 TRINITY_DN18307_c0_g1~~TRINITY_DN18307_c0_g1_i1.p1  ORF type:complete len:167 (-),score=23.82 TRINITY_DN18307_c0_g1_i1:58-558(-)
MQLLAIVTLVLAVVAGTHAKCTTVTYGGNTVTVKTKWHGAIALCDSMITKLTFGARVVSPSDDNMNFFFDYNSDFDSCPERVSSCTSARGQCVQMSQSSRSINATRNLPRGIFCVYIGFECHNLIYTCHGYINYAEISVVTENGETAILSLPSTLGSNITSNITLH